MLDFWLDSKPAILGDLRPEELRCLPGDRDGAARIASVLRDYYDTNREKFTGSLSGLTTAERADVVAARRWIKYWIRAWTRRADSPSAWFAHRGTTRPAGEQFGHEYREAVALQRAEAVLRYYEGRVGPAPDQVRAAAEAGRAESRERARRQRAREKARLRAAAEAANPEPEWMSPEEREHIYVGIARGIEEIAKARAGRG